MKLTPYKLTKSIGLTVEHSNTSSGFIFEAPKGTIFYGKWIASKATKGMGDLALENGMCIPLCPKFLFEKTENPRKMRIVGA